jgi:alkanesulfonate monooxygenase SsuD/methylene tetrahydromethanopterin reductase-like flavin-dependent oxidoreductase (luciferase family)
MRIGYQLLFQNGHQGMSDGEMTMKELRLVELAEPLGFDTIWCVEHHFDAYSMCPDNTQLLSYLAGRTQRIHLGSAAVILPWNDPLRVVEKVSLLDHLCNGRYLFGMGRGLARMEYNGFRVDMNEARGRFNEASKSA